MSVWERRIRAAAVRIAELEQELAAEFDRRDGLICDARDQDGVPYRRLGAWAGVTGSAAADIVARESARRQ